MPSHKECSGYHLGRVLGKGVTSVVHLAVSISSKQKVALKILFKNHLQGMEKTKRAVETEIAALDKINHPNVLRMHSCNWKAIYPKRDGSKKEAVAIALELAPNGELFDYLMHTGSFSENVARTYFHQLVAGLEACHDKGVVHRDLKPDNLLLDKNFVLKLADFGYSKLSTKGYMYTYVGTRGYMAPEVVDPNQAYTKSCDIWSSGVILFLMYAGFPPYMEPKKSDWWFNKLCDGNFNKFWQAHEQTMTFDSGFKDLINRMLTYDSTRRIALDQIKQHRWFQGTTLNTEALLLELNRRKPRVDEIKQIEGLEGKNQSSSIGEGGMRSVGPGFARGGSVTNLLDDGFDDEDFELDEKSLPSAKPYSSGDVRCYNVVKTQLTPKEALVRIAASSGGQFECDSEDLIIEVCTSTGRGENVFSAEIYSDPDKKDHSVVAVRRIQGDWQSFRAQFRALEKVLLS